jgi:hypothetical protein
LFTAREIVQSVVRPLAFMLGGQERCAVPGAVIAWLVEGDVVVFAVGNVEADECEQADPSRGGEASEQALRAAGGDGYAAQGGAEEGADE